MPQNKLTQRVIEILNQKSCFIDDMGKITVGLCVQQGLANKEIPRSENKWEIEYQKDKEWLATQITKELKQEWKKEMIKEIKRIWRSCGHRDDWGIQVIYLNMFLKELREPGYFGKAERKRKEKLKKLLKKKKKPSPITS